MTASCTRTSESASFFPGGYMFTVVFETNSEETEFQTHNGSRIYEVLFRYRKSECSLLEANVHAVFVFLRQ